MQQPQSRARMHEWSQLYEEKIKRMGNAGRNGGEEVKPRRPKEIMAEIAALDAESAEVLAGIRRLQ